MVWMKIISSEKVIWQIGTLPDTVSSAYTGRRINEFTCSRYKKIDTTLWHMVKGDQRVALQLREHVKYFVIIHITIDTQCFIGHRNIQCDCQL
jgi:hypothetical protein